MPRALKRHRPPVTHQRHTQVLKSGRSQQDMQCPAHYTWRIHSPDASPTLMQPTDPGEMETNSRERACWAGNGAGISSSSTALPALPWASHLKPFFPPPFLFVFSPPPPFLFFPCFFFISYLYHPVLQQTRITGSSFYLQLREFSPAATWLEHP